MIGRVIKIIILIMLVSGLIYFGTCVYANFFAFNPQNTGTELPEPTEAPHMVVIENSGNVLFTADYDTYGTVIVLHGFYEKVGNEFKFRDRDLILDQAVFGPITIRGTPIR